MDVATLGEINAFLQRNSAPFARPEGLIQLLDRFNESNEDPKTSPNLRLPDPDDVRLLAGILGDSRCRNLDKLVYSLLRTLKIASRKLGTRSALSPGLLAAVDAHVKAPKSAKIAREAVSVVLNACYEKQHVDTVVADGVVGALVAYLGADDRDLQAAAAGALQSICFQEKGKVAVRESGAISDLVKLLASPYPKSSSRAAGALHNLSSDVLCIPLIRDAGGLLPLVSLLKADNVLAAGSAAGAIQNISREVGCRDALREMDVVMGLTDLLFSSDVNAVVSAVGALLNILGQDFGVPDDSNAERRAFRKLLSLCVTLGSAYHGLFDALPPDTS